MRKGAAEGTLFLNTDGTFPLKEAGKIAAYGAGVRNTVKGGTGSGEVNSRFSVNIEQGLLDVQPPSNIMQSTIRKQTATETTAIALREIYLKGFGICVKKAKPLAVMTSYNLLNGTHTSEHRGLCWDLLRKEYGFDGLVMTDWVISFAEKKGGKYRIAHSPETAMAGGDLFMPGGKADYEKLFKALKEGKVTKEQAKINATRVYHFAKLLGKK